MTERSSALPGLLGCLTGLGCGMVLLAGCVASWLFLADGSPAPPDIDTPPYVPPYVPPAPPPVPPGGPLLPPPPIVPPTIPPAPPGALAPASDTAPRLVRATVTEASGSAGIAVGAMCEFHVERTDNSDSTFACNAQIVCGGRLLYGGPGAGFFPCTLYEGPPRHVVGADENSTSGDNDGAMRLDTHGSLEIWDDSTGPNGEFRVVAHVDSVE